MIGSSHSGGKCCAENHLRLTTIPDECAHDLPRYPYAGRGHLDLDSASGSLALEVNQLCVTYRVHRRVAVNGISLKVHPGQRVALIGHNGAGKSTLLKAAAGLIRPDSGEILVYGSPVGVYHHRTAYLPQRSDVDWHFPVTLAELVMTGRFVHMGWFRRPRRSDRQLVQAALNRLSVADLADRQIAELSGGQQQRALIARALVQQASLFLLDEPLNAVDETTRCIVDEVLADHVAVGGSVLVATHDLGRLSESFDRAIFLSDGRIDRVEDMPGGPSKAVTEVRYDSLFDQPVGDSRG